MRCCHGTEIIVFFWKTCVCNKKRPETFAMLVFSCGVALLASSALAIRKFYPQKWEQIKMGGRYAQLTLANKCTQLYWKLCGTKPKVRRPMRRPQLSR